MRNFLLKLTLILFGTALGLLLFLFLDTLAGVYLPNSGYYRYALFPDPAIPPLGRIPDRDKINEVKKKQSGEIMYSAEYNFDSYKRRITPQAETKKEKTILFFGGSNTFGDGLNDDQTIPAKLAINFKNVQFYNYAFKGYGPQNMLAKLRAGFAENEISPKSGIAFYQFFDFHIRRVVGTAQVVMWAHGNHPFYELGANGQLVDRGFFSTARPVYNFLVWHLANTYLFRHFKSDFPKIEEKHYQLTCAIIKESAIRLKNLGFELYLFGPQGTSIYEPVNSCLTKELQIHSAKDFLGEIEPYLYEDGHLNPLGAQKMADWLTDFIKTLKF